MTSHNRHMLKRVGIQSVMASDMPLASNEPYDDDDSEARERRREERRKRKKDKRRREMALPEEEGDPDLLLEEPKKQKRKKMKKARPELWVDEEIEDAEFDEALEYDSERKSRRKNDDDWYDEWDS